MNVFPGLDFRSSRPGRLRKGLLTQRLADEKLFGLLGPDRCATDAAQADAGLLDPFAVNFECRQGHHNGEVARSATELLKSDPGFGIE